MVNSKNMKYLAVIIILISVFSFKSNNDLIFCKFKGHVIDSVSSVGQPFLGVKLFVNDTLWGSSTTDLDGFFVVVCMKEIGTNDRIKMEFHSSVEIFEERIISPITQDNMKVFYKLNDSISSKELREWHYVFRSSIPNYLDCHPTEPLDEFEIKKN